MADYETYRGFSLCLKNGVVSLLDSAGREYGPDETIEGAPMYTALLSEYARKLYVAAVLVRCWAENDATEAGIETARMFLSRSSRSIHHLSDTAEDILRARALREEQNRKIADEGDMC
jgi:hypothetical protein